MIGQFNKIFFQVVFCDYTNFMMDMMHAGLMGTGGFDHRILYHDPSWPGVSQCRHILKPMKAVIMLMVRAGIRIIMNNNI